MRIGIPKEIKDSECRVGMTPAGVEELVRAGHTVRVEMGAGIGSSIPDSEYAHAGAVLVASASEAWDADLVVKVKEPLPSEFDFLHPQLTLFTYLHLASQLQLVGELQQRGVRAIGYETVQLDNGALPLLAPMSQVAGKMATQIGATLLQHDHGGRGILLGGVAGTAHGRVVILGGGHVGLNAAKIANGLGAQVMVADTNPSRLVYIDDIFHGKVITMVPTRRHIHELLADCDLLIGAALMAGARTPQVIERAMLRNMKPGSVLVDVSIDQGGIAETSRPTSLSNPTYVEEGIIHYCVTNIPGCVPATSTSALTSATLPYVLKLATQGVEAALASDAALGRGLNIEAGAIRHPAVARAVAG